MAYRNAFLQNLFAKKKAAQTPTAAQPSADASGTGTSTANAAAQVTPATSTPAATTSTPAAAATPTTPTTKTTPTINYDDYARQAADLLGPSPEQRRAEEERRRVGKEKVAGWLSFFDALRTLGQAAGINAGAPYVKMGDTAAKYNESATAAETQRQQQDAADAAYRTKIYELQQKAKAEQRTLADRQRKQEREDASDARAVEKAQREKDKETRQQELDAERLRTAKAKADRAEIETKNMNNGKTASGGVPSQGSSGNGGKQTEAERVADIKMEWENLPDSAKQMTIDRNTGETIYPNAHQMEAQLNAYRKKNGGGSSGGGKKNHKGGNGGKKIHKK